MLAPKYTKLAIQDMRQAYDYIAIDSQQSAKAVIERIESGINTLCAHPNIGQPGRHNGAREFVIARTPFIVVYSPHQPLLWILCILHTSKKYPGRIKISS
jgi:plasmid stabilization system protein ParE